MIDSEKLQLSLTYCLIFKVSPPIRVCKTRFEIDPDAPLVRFFESTKELSYG